MTKTKTKTNVTQSGVKEFSKSNILAELQTGNLITLCL